MRVCVGTGRRRRELRRVQRRGERRRRWRRQVRGEPAWQWVLRPIGLSRTRPHTRAHTLARTHTQTDPPTRWRAHTQTHIRRPRSMPIVWFESQLCRRPCRWMQRPAVPYEWQAVGGNGWTSFLASVDARGGKSGEGLGAILALQLQARAGQSQPPTEGSTSYGIFVEANEAQYAAARRRETPPFTTLAWSVPTIGARLPPDASTLLGRTVRVMVVVGNYPGNGHTPKLFLADFTEPTKAHPSLRLLARTGGLVDAIVAHVMSLHGASGYDAALRSMRSVPAREIAAGGIHNPSFPLSGDFFADLTSAAHVGANERNKARPRTHPSDAAWQAAHGERAAPEHAVGLADAPCGRCRSDCTFGRVFGQIHDEGWKDDSRALLKKLVTDGDAAVLMCFTPGQFGLLVAAVDELKDSKGAPPRRVAGQAAGRRGRHARAAPSPARVEGRGHAVGRGRGQRRHPAVAATR